MGGWSRQFAWMAGCALAGLGYGQMGYVVTPGTQFDRCETSNGWTVSDGGSVAVDGSRRIEGAGSLRITSAPNWDVGATRASNLDLSAGGTIRYRLFVQQPVQAGDGLVASLHLTSNNFGSYFAANTQRLHAGWNTIVLSKLDFAAESGSPSWSTPMTRMRFYFNNRLGGPIIVNLDDVVVGEKTRPKVIFAFDDNYSEAYDIAYPYLRSHGMRGTAFVIGSKLDQPGRFTTAQGNEMYNYGWDMANHTMTHADLTTLSPSAALAELQNCRNLLIAKGWTRAAAYAHVAYPYGAFNESLLTTMANAGLLTGRTIFRQRQANDLDERYMLTVDIPDWEFDRNAQIFARLDRLVAAGGVLQLCFHHLVSGTPASSMEWNRDDFCAIVDRVAMLRNQGLLDVVTLSEWYGGLFSGSLNGFSIMPASVEGGKPATGTVTLDAPASGTGAVINLWTPDPIAEPPSTVTVPAGQTSASFPIKTYQIDDTTTYTLTASYGGKTRTASLTLEAVADPLSGLSIAPSSVVGGVPSYGTVVLSVPAGAGGVVVALASSSSMAKVPTSVKVPAGQTSAAFTIQTFPIAHQTTYSITASHGNTSRSANITLKPVPAPLSSLTLSQTAVKGGATLYGTVKLAAAAPSAGVSVAISESSAVIDCPATVSVSPYTNSKSFAITTFQIGATTTYVITASASGVTKTASLTVMKG